MSENREKQVIDLKGKIDKYFIVFSHIKQKPSTAQEIIKETHIAQSNVYKIINYLLGIHLIRIIEAGPLKDKYTLFENTEPEIEIEKAGNDTMTWFTPPFFFSPEAHIDKIVEKTGFSPEEVKKYYYRLSHKHNWPRKGLDRGFRQ
ncbi:MAG: hypothetical protein ABIA21_02220 [Candidatus Aenigmatarchaeota archaeon]